MTKVINIRKAPSDWTLDNTYVYIGRPGKGMFGLFGNPVAVGKVCPVCDGRHVTPGSTLMCYETYIRERLVNDKQFKNKFLALRDKILVCFCKPSVCHGDIIVKVLNEYN